MNTILFFKATLIFSILALTGCSTFTGISNAYPKNWPEVLNTGSECPDISGIYKDRGLSTTYNINFKEYLANRLDNSDITFQAHTTRIDKINDSAYSVVALNAQGKTIETFILSRDTGDYECMEGKIWLKIIRDPWNLLAGHVGSITQIGYTKAIDGTLIGEERNGAKLQFSQVFWYQWQQVEQKN